MLKSKCWTWNGKQLNETSSLQPQTKTLTRVSTIVAVRVTASLIKQTKLIKLLYEKTTSIFFKNFIPYVSSSYGNIKI